MLLYLGFSLIIKTRYDTVESITFSSKSEKTANAKTLRGKYLICLSEINKATMAGEQGELS